MSAQRDGKYGYGEAMELRPGRWIRAEGEGQADGSAYRAGPAASRTWACAWQWTMAGAAAGGELVEWMADPVRSQVAKKF